MLESVRSRRIDCNPSARCVIRIATHRFLQTGLQSGFALDSQRLVVRRAFTLRPSVQNEHRLAMQVIGRPVGSDVGSMSPNRSDLLSSNRLPHALSKMDGFSLHHHAAVRRHHLRGRRRPIVNGVISHPAQHAEGGNEHHRQRNPQLLVFHYISPNESCVQLNSGARILQRNCLGKQNVVFQMNVLMKVRFECLQRQVTRLESGAGVFRSRVVVAVFTQASQRFASRGVFQFHHVNRAFDRTEHRTRFRQSSGGRLFQLNDVRKENVLFLHQVRRQFCAQCGKGFLNRMTSGCFAPCLRGDLGQQLLDTHRLLAHVNMVRRRYVVDQNA